MGYVGVQIDGEGASEVTVEAVWDGAQLFGVPTVDALNRLKSWMTTFPSSVPLA